MSENNQVNLYQLIQKLNDTFNYLLKKWIILCIIGLFGGALGLVTSLLTPKKYSSKLSFVIEDQSSKGNALASIASSFGMSSASDGFFNTANIIDFLKMRSIVEKALLEIGDEKKNKTFVQMYIDAYKLRDDWKDETDLKDLKYLPGENRSSFTLKKDSVLGDIYKRLIKNEELIVKQPNLENSIVNIDVSVQSELFAKNFGEKLINLAGDFYIESKTKLIRTNIEIMEQQLDSIKRELISSMSGAASANDDVFGLNPSMNVKRVPSIRKQVDVQVNSAIHLELVKNLEMTKFNLLNQTPSIQIIDKPVLPLEEVTLRKSIAIVVGGIIFGFIGVLYFTGKRFIQNLKPELNE